MSEMYLAQTKIPRVLNFESYEKFKTYYAPYFGYNEELILFNYRNQDLLHYNAAEARSGNTDAPFPGDPEATVVSIAHRPKGFVAGRVSPIYLATQKTVRYYEHNQAASYTIPPNIRIQRDGVAPEVNRSAGDRTAECYTTAVSIKYGLSDLDQIRSSGEYRNWENSLIVQITDNLLLQYERDVQDVVFNANNYVFKRTLSGSDRFDQPQSDPWPILTQAMEEPLTTPNVCVIGVDAWTHLRTNPKIVGRAGIRDDGSGIINERMFADALGVDEVIVGRTRYNTSIPGSSDITYTRIWGKSLALFYRGALTGEMNSNDIMNSPSSMMMGMDPRERHLLPEWMAKPPYWLPQLELGGENDTFVFSAFYDPRTIIRSHNPELGDSGCNKLLARQTYVVINPNQHAGYLLSEVVS